MRAAEVLDVLDEVEVEGPLQLGKTALPGRRSCGVYYGSRGPERLKFLSPISFSLCAVLLLKPRDVVAIGSWDRYIGSNPPAQSLVDRTHFTHQQGNRPTVQNDMVVRPTEIDRLLVQANNADTDQGRLRQIEPSLAIPL